MDCKELDQPVLVTIIFRENNEKEISRILTCFYTHYYEIFKRILYQLAGKYPFLKDDPEFYADQAFTDGLLAFYERMREKDFVEGKARLKTFFFSFCIFKLRALIQKWRRDNDKNKKMIQDTKNDWLPRIEEKDLLTENEALLEKALGMLDERKRQYIILRKYEGRTDAEIAEIMGITPGAVGNEVYKAFLKLKKIIDLLKGKK